MRCPSCPSKKHFLFLTLAVVGLVLAGDGLYIVIAYHFNYWSGDWSLLYGGAALWLALLVQLLTACEQARNSTADFPHDQNRIRGETQFLVPLCALMLAVSGMLMMWWEVTNVLCGTYYHPEIFVTSGFFYFVSAISYPVVSTVLTKRIAKQRTVSGANANVVSVNHPGTGTMAMQRAAGTETADTETTGTETTGTETTGAEIQTSK